jgi:uncharacterized Zn finger protein (UPF0148 family)
MLQGYKLKESQCDQCGMPQMEYQSILHCVVCPVLAKKAKKELRRMRKRKEKGIVETDDVDDNDTADIVEEVLQQKRVDEERKSSKSEIEEEVLQQERVDEESKSSKSEIVKEVLQQKRVDEERKSLKSEIAKEVLQQKRADEERKSSKSEHSESHRKRNNRSKKLEERPKIASQHKESTNEARVKKRYEDAKQAKNKSKKSSKEKKRKHSVKDPKKKGKNSAQSLTSQESHESYVVASSAPGDVRSADARRRELEAKEKRLLEEAKKAREEVKAFQNDDYSQASVLAEYSRRQEEALRAEEMRNDQLRLIVETKRLETMERMRLANEIEFKSPQESTLAVFALQEERKRLRKEALRQKEIRAFEKARQEAELEARRIADEKRAAHEAEMIEALEHEAQRKAREAEEAVAKAKAALEEVTSAKKGIIAQVIAQGEADTIAETEAIVRAEAEDYHEETVLPSASFLWRERWETLRFEGRSVMTRRLIAGWTMLPRYCVGIECQNSPLLTKGGKIECVVCGGSGSGEDGAYVAPLKDIDTYDGYNEEESDEPILTEKSTIVTNTAVVRESINDDDRKPNTFQAVQKIHEDFEEKRTMVSKEIGKRMLQGWTLLDMSCPNCVMPLLTDEDGVNEICVICGVVGKMNKESAEDNYGLDYEQGKQHVRDVQKGCAGLTEHFQEDENFQAMQQEYKGTKERLNKQTRTYIEQQQQALEEKCRPERVEQFHDIQNGCVEAREHISDIALQTAQYMNTHLNKHKPIIEAHWRETSTQILSKQSVKGMVAMISKAPCSPGAFEDEESCNIAMSKQIPTYGQKESIIETNESSSMGSSEAAAQAYGVPSLIEDKEDLELPGFEKNTKKEQKFQPAVTYGTPPESQEVSQEKAVKGKKKAQGREKDSVKAPKSFEMLAQKFNKTAQEAKQDHQYYASDAIGCPTDEATEATLDSMKPIADFAIDKPRKRTGDFTSEKPIASSPSPKRNGRKKNAVAVALEKVAARKDRGKAAESGSENGADQSQSFFATLKPRAILKHGLTIDTSAIGNIDQPPIETPKTPKTPKTPGTPRSTRATSKPSPLLSPHGRYHRYSAESPTNYNELSARLRSLLADSKSPRNTAGTRVSYSAPSSPCRRSRGPPDYLISSITGRKQSDRRISNTHEDPPAMTSTHLTRRIARDPEDKSELDDNRSRRSSNSRASRTKPFPGMSPRAAPSPRPSAFPKSPSASLRKVQDDSEGVTLVIPKDFDVTNDALLRDLILQAKSGRKGPSPEGAHEVLRGKIFHEGDTEIIDLIDVELPDDPPEGNTASQTLSSRSTRSEPGLLATSLKTSPKHRMLQVETQIATTSSRHGAPSPGEREPRPPHSFMHSPHGGDDIMVNAMHPPYPGEDGPRSIVRKRRPKVTPESMMRPRANMKKKRPGASEPGDKLRRNPSESKSERSSNSSFKLSPTTSGVSPRSQGITSGGSHGSSSMRPRSHGIASGGSSGGGRTSPRSNSMRHDGSGSGRMSPRSSNSATKTDSGASSPKSHSMRSGSSVSLDPDNIDPHQFYKTSHSSSEAFTGRPGDKHHTLSNISFSSSTSSKYSNADNTKPRTVIVDGFTSQAFVSTKGSFGGLPPKSPNKRRRGSSFSDRSSDSVASASSTTNVGDRSISDSTLEETGMDPVMSTRNERNSRRKMIGSKEQIADTPPEIMVLGAGSSGGIEVLDPLMESSNGGRGRSTDNTKGLHDADDTRSVPSVSFAGIIKRIDSCKTKLGSSKGKPNKMVDLIEKLTTAAADVDTVEGSIDGNDSLNSR